MGTVLSYGLTFAAGALGLVTFVYAVGWWLDDDRPCDENGFE